MNRKVGSVITLVRQQTQTIATLENRLQEANKELEKLHKAAIKKENEIEGLKSCISDYDDNEKRLKSELEASKTRLKEREKEREEWAQERMTILDELQHLKTKVPGKIASESNYSSGKSKDIKLETGEVDSLLTKMGQYENMLDELSKLNEFLTARTKTAEEKTSSLEQQLETLQKTFQTMEKAASKLPEAESQARRLEHEIKLMNEAVDLANRSNQTLSDQITYQEMELAEVRSRLDRALNERKDLSCALEESKIRLDLVESKLALKDEEIRQHKENSLSQKETSVELQVLQDAYRRLEAKLSDQGCEIAVLQDEKKTLVDRLHKEEGTHLDAIQEVMKEREDLTHKFTIAVTELNRNKCLLEEKTREVEDLESKVRELKRGQTQLAELEVDLEEYRLKVDRLSRDKDNLKEQVRDVKSAQEKDLRQEIDQLVDRLKAASSRNSELEAELRTKKAALSSMTERVNENSILIESETRLKLQVQALKDELSAAVRECDKLKILNHGLESQITNLSSISNSLAAKNEEITELEKSLADLQAANKDLRSKLTREKEASVTRSPRESVMAKEKENENLRASLKVKEEVIFELQARLQEIDQIRERNLSLEEANSKEKVQNERLRLQINTSRRESELASSTLQSVQNQLKSTQEQLESVKTDLRSKETLLTIAYEENKALESRLRMAQRAAENREEEDEEISKLKENLHSAESDASSWKERAEDASAVIRRLKEELEKEKRDVRRVQGLNDELKHEVMGVSVLREELAYAQEQLEAIEGVHKHEMGLKQEEVNALKEQLQASNSANLAQMSAQNTEIELLRNKISQSEAKHEEVVTALKQNISDLQKQANEPKGGYTSRTIHEDSRTIKSQELRHNNRVVLQELPRSHNDNSHKYLSNEGSHINNFHSPVEDDRVELLREIDGLKKRIASQEDYIQNELKRSREIREKSIELRKSSHSVNTQQQPVPHPHRMPEGIECMKLDRDGLYSIIARKEALEKELRRTIQHQQREIDCLKEELKKQIISGDHNERIAALQLKVESQSREIAKLHSQENEREDAINSLQQHYKRLLKDNDRLKSLLEESERQARRTGNAQPQAPLSETHRYSEKSKLESALQDMQVRMASLVQENDRLCALLRRNQISHPDPMASMKKEIFEHRRSASPIGNAARKSSMSPLQNTKKY